jgi:hypothetical protein
VACAAAVQHGVDVGVCSVSVGSVGSAQWKGYTASALTSVTPVSSRLTKPIQRTVHRALYHPVMLLMLHHHPISNQFTTAQP